MERLNPHTDEQKLKLTNDYDAKLKDRWGYCVPRETGLAIDRPFIFKFRETSYSEEKGVWVLMWKVGRNPNRPQKNLCLRRYLKCTGALYSVNNDQFILESERGTLIFYGTEPHNLTSACTKVLQTVGFSVDIVEKWAGTIWDACHDRKIVMGSWKQNRQPAKSGVSPVMKQILNEIQPSDLPFGWEAKIEPESGRTFYLDHITKTTTWTKPERVQEDASDVSSPVRAPSIVRRQTAISSARSTTSSVASPLPTAPMKQILNDCDASDLSSPPTARSATLSQVPSPPSSAMKSAESSDDQIIFLDSALPSTASMKSSCAQTTFRALKRAMSDESEDWL